MLFCGAQYGLLAPFVGVVVLERCGGAGGGLVFGTLLGPEATGPWHHGRSVPPCGGMCPGVVVWDLCFWFPGCTEHARLRVWGVWYGVVV